MRATATSLTSDEGVERSANGDVVAFRLFRAGVSRTDRGAQLFDTEAARLVMADRNERGNRFALDFDHLSLDPTATPEQRRAAGSFDLAIRAGELWAVDVRLTAEAAEFLRRGQYLSVSPAYDVDRESRRVLRVVNCALTSNPATHEAVRLAASRIQKKTVESEVDRALGLTKTVEVTVGAAVDHALGLTKREPPRAGERRLPTHLTPAMAREMAEQMKEDGR